LTSICMGMLSLHPDESDHHDGKGDDGNDGGLGKGFDEKPAGEVGTDTGKQSNGSEFDPAVDCREREKYQLEGDDKWVMREVDLVGMGCQGRVKGCGPVPIPFGKGKGRAQGTNAEKIEEQEVERPTQYVPELFRAVQHDVPAIKKEAQKNREGDCPRHAVSRKQTPFDPPVPEAQDTQTEIDDKEKQTGRPKLNYIAKGEERLRIGKTGGQEKHGADRDKG